MDIEVCEGWSVEQRKAVRDETEAFGVVMTKLAFEQAALEKQYANSRSKPAEAWTAKLAMLKPRYQAATDVFLARVEAITTQGEP